jgi:S-adenosylmethionine:tRNA ribosyltransferase-isomerase
VIPARLVGKKKTGGKAELLILDYEMDYESGHAGNHAGAGREAAGDGNREFDCLIKTSGRPKPGTVIYFDHGLTAEVVQYRDGIYRVMFFFEGDFEALLYRIGQVPLPPYISRSEGNQTADDRQTYQTVYASQKGAVAAPTAGFHFTRKLIDNIRAGGVRIVSVTLHVSYGTFLPVRAKDIRQHRMHAERYIVPEETAEEINRTRTSGGRVIAVGTTCVRTLEHASDEKGTLAPGSGSCELFIYPGYGFRVVDAMVTNFHLPRSTLLMLVSAFAGRENILNAYSEAIREGYRFYSYGDAMFIV